MRKVKAIVGLLILLFVVYTISMVSARSEDLAEEDLALPPGLSEEPVEECEGDPIDTTNPYKNIAGSPLGERYLAEGPRPLNVLVFADEEAVPQMHWVGTHRVGKTIVNIYKDWEDYAVWQIERGDEALVAQFGIDLRVIGALTWDSDDSKEDFEDLFYEFWYENEHYLRSEYNGTVVDIIIGITAQKTFEEPRLAGRAEPLNVVLLRWQAYWVDDNLVQHEISHLFYLLDRQCGVWCDMGTQKVLTEAIIEDGYVWVLWLTEVYVSYLTYDYCSVCYNIMNNHKDRFPIPPGDADLDGDVDAADYHIWHENLWATYPNWTFWRLGTYPNKDPDFDNDGVVDYIDDFYIWVSNAVLHDVAVTSVSPSPTSVRVGQPVTITVGVWNKGDYTETFSVTAYYDGTAISTQTVNSLAAGGSTTLTFTWNTAGRSPGRYTVKAVASTVLDEIGKADNTCTDGTVEVYWVHDVAVTSVTASPTSVRVGESVTITVTVKNEGDYAENFNVTAITLEQLDIFWSMGDVNRDGYINEVDLNLIGEHSKIGVPYDPKYDINKDGAVDVYDLAICAGNDGLDFWTYFGLTPPQIVNLPAGSSSTVTFTWNTAGMQAGTYTIKAIAGRVAGETETVDNSRTDGTVTVEYHDVAVTSVTASRAKLNIGESVTITVTVKNEGDYTETFAVTAYYNSTAISTQTVTSLTAGGNTTLTFIWNTAGMSGNQAGTYTIKAVASTVAGETDTADNTRVDGLVKVRIPGDGNFDGHVDMTDFYLWQQYFGTTPDKWPSGIDPDYDNNGLVDMPDYYIWRANFGLW